METVVHQVAQRPRPPRRKSSAPLIAGGLAGAFFCLVIAVGLAVLLFAPKRARAIESSVTINSPLPSAQAAVNAPLGIIASAYNDDGIKRVEIYADGALVAAQDSTDPGGLNPLIFQGAWIPLTTGRHILIARAYPSGGGFITSEAVPVDVLDRIPEDLSITTEEQLKVHEIASALNSSVEDVLASNPDLPTDPDADVPPGTEVEVPPGDPAPPPAEPPAPPAPMPGAPSAPTGLNITADCTTASLTWTDAPDETGYTVYRLDPPLLNPISILPANATNFADTLPALGTYQYSVASVKDGLESLTPFVAVSTPADCVPPLPPAIAISDLVLTMETLETGTPWDGVYCYFDINGTGYQRVPPLAFQYMTPGGDGVTYDLSTQLPDGGQYHVTADTSAGLTLSGECWGRNGAEISLLGTFSQTYGPETWDDSQQIILASEAGKDAPGHSTPSLITGNFEIKLHIGEVVLGPPPGPIIDIFPFPGWIDVILGILQLPAPSNLAIGPNVAGCDEETGFSYALCVALAGLSGGPTTLTWSWTGNTYHDEAHLTRYFVRLRAVDAGLGTETTLYTANVYRDAPGTEIRRSKMVPTEGLPCGSDIYADVQAFEGTTASTVSTILWQTTPACSEMEITVTFNSITLSNQDGFGDLHDVGSTDFCFLCTDSMLELVTSLGVNSVHYESVQTGGSLLNPCPSDAWCITPGTHNLATFYTWPIDWDGAPRQLVIHQPYTHDVFVWFGMQEVDGGVSSTLAGCGGGRVFSAANPADWGSINGTYDATAPMGIGEEGQCTLNYTIEGHELP